MTEGKKKAIPRVRGVPTPPSLTVLLTEYEYSVIKEVILEWIRVDPHAHLKKYGPLCPLDYQLTYERELRLKQARDRLRKLSLSYEQ